MATKKFLKLGIDKTPNPCYNKDTVKKEVDTMKKFNTNEKVRFEIATTRKSDHFVLKWEGQLTMIEPATASDLKDALLVQFLAEVNLPRDEQRKYRPNEVKITIWAI